MAKYEMIREMFNLCAGNQMRDVSIEEVTTDDPVAYVHSIIEGDHVRITQDPKDDGTITLLVEDAGFRQRFSFSEI